MTTEMPEGLARLFVGLLERRSQPTVDPPFLRPEGRSDAGWLADLATARLNHNGSALRLKVLVDELSAEAPGTAARLNPLPGGTPELASTTDYEVPLGGTTALADFGPFREGFDVPVGPDSPFEELEQQNSLSVRHYRAHGSAPQPCIVTLHGGAFWMGGGDASRELDGPLAEWLARRLGISVVDVDYRLAPEHPFPAPIIDVLVVLDWLRENSELLGVDVSRLAVLGVSSGGNLAAAATIVDTARQTAFPRLAAQILVVPALDLGGLGPFHRSSDDARRARARQMQAYLGDTDPRHPLASPAISANPDGLPSAVIVTAQFDEVALGGAEWAAALREAGIEVREHSYPMTHTIAEPATSARMAEDLAADLEVVLVGPASSPAGTIA